MLPGEIYIGAENVYCGGTLDMVVSGNANYSITIKSLDSNNKATLLRNFQNAKVGNEMIRILYAENVHIQNIIFNDAANAIWLHSSKNCSIEGCEFYINDFELTGGGGAILIQGDNSTCTCSYNYINHNKIIYSEDVLEALTIFKNLKPGEPFLYRKSELYHGIYLSSYSTYNSVNNNTIYNAPGCRIHVCHPGILNNVIRANSIYVCYDNTNILDEYNIEENIYKPKEINYRRYGILVNDGSNNTIEDNLLYSTTAYYNQNHDLPGNNNLLRYQYENANTIQNNQYFTNTAFVHNCLNSKSTESDRYYSGNIKVYEFIPGEIFVVIENSGEILKIRNSGGLENNMFAIEKDGEDYKSIAGYNYLMGTQIFNKKITSLTYAEGYTFIGFSDGRLLKILGTGGTGPNMFKVIETYNGFNTTSENSYYYVGSHLFNSGILDIQTLKIIYLCELRVKN